MKGKFDAYVLSPLTKIVHHQNNSGLGQTEYQDEYEVRPLKCVLTSIRKIIKLEVHFLSVRKAKIITVKRTLLPCRKPQKISQRFFHQIISAAASF